VILAEALEVFIRELGQTGDVHVATEVGNLDGTGNGIGEEI